ncbi:MAG: hypothetical protein ACI4AM_04865 [Muribaculaceae bacterium]
MKKLILLLLPLMVAMLSACSEMDQLDREVEQLNKRCPMYVSMGMEITEVSRSDSELLIVCTVDESLAGEDVIDMLDEAAIQIRAELRASLKNDKDNRKVAKLLADNNMGLVYEYRGSITGKCMRVVFTSSDLRSM